MKNLFVIIFILVSVSACEKDKPDSIVIDNKYIARIAGFEDNCSTAILEFPDDSTEVKSKIGESSNNLYNVVNLSRDNYREGQLLSVRIRQAGKNEIAGCQTNLKSIYLTELGNSDEMILNDTIEISNQGCKFNIDDQFYLCLDTLLDDNRCPTGAVCILAGAARVRFHFEKLNEPPVYFLLHTSDPPHEITIDRYKIKLLDVLPHPSTETIYLPETKNQIQAKVIVQKVQ